MTHYDHSRLSARLDRLERIVAAIKAIDRGRLNPSFTNRDLAAAQRQIDESISLLTLTENGHQPYISRT